MITSHIDPTNKYHFIHDLLIEVRPPVANRRTAAVEALWNWNEHAQELLPDLRRYFEGCLLLIQLCAQESGQPHCSHSWSFLRGAAPTRSKTLSAPRAPQSCAHTSFFPGVVCEKINQWCVGQTVPLFEERGTWFPSRGFPGEIESAHPVLGLHSASNQRALGVLTPRKPILNFFGGQ